jgi:hypothetical protein
VDISDTKVTNIKDLLKNENSVEETLFSDISLELEEQIEKSRIGFLLELEKKKLELKKRENVQILYCIKEFVSHLKYTKKLKI